jgi:adenylate kinase
MKIAVTGTPGVGKTSACALVSSLRVVHVNDLVDELGVVSGYDRKRRTKEVDAKKLAKAVAKMDGDAIFEGHFSHMLGVDFAIVLRCSPKVLDKRLRKKRWPEKKIRENIEAEAVDVILVETLENVDTVCEIDTTRKTPKQVARAIERIVAGESEKYPVGNVDWSQEVLSWF